jgi:hypothetical protein
MLTSPAGHVGKREWVTLVLNGLPHTRSRYMIVVAEFAERISATLRTAVRTNCSTTIGALGYRSLAARHPKVVISEFSAFAFSQSSIACP